MHSSATPAILTPARAACPRSIDPRHSTSQTRTSSPQVLTSDTNSYCLASSPCLRCFVVRPDEKNSFRPVTRRTIPRPRFHETLQTRRRSVGCRAPDRRTARTGWPLATTTRGGAQDLAAANQPPRIARLRRPFSQHAPSRRPGPRRPRARDGIDRIEQSRRDTCIVRFPSHRPQTRVSAQSGSRSNVLHDRRRSSGT